MSVLLTLNAGSSSIKFSLWRRASFAQIAEGQVDRLGEDEATLTLKSDDKRTEIALGTVDHAGAVSAILSALDPVLDGITVAGVGHRVVHGGPDRAAPEILSDAAIDALEDLVPLAPLHQPHNIAAIRAARAAFPDALQIGCFDTAFHRNRPFVHDTYGLPRQYYDEGVRRYGFHGLSYDYISGRLREIDPALAAGRVVVAHLGNGASACALRDGRAVSTTMGFSALDGLVMGTRPGQLDPGVLLYLMQQGRSADEITHLLYKQSGLEGLSGISNDMRELLASDAPGADQALDYYVVRLCREIAALAADLGGLDGLIFCGGVGENAAPIRARVGEGLGWMGVSVDAGANATHATDIGNGAVRVLVIPTDEEQVIARAVDTALG